VLWISFALPYGTTGWFGFHLEAHKYWGVPPFGRAVKFYFVKFYEIIIIAKKTV
jgi:hypothetical protein